MEPSLLVTEHSLENDQLCLTLLKDGAKLTRFHDRRMGRDWLLPSQASGGGYPKVTYGADFSLFDTSGLDECFPNVSEGPHPGEDFQWPDHGEVWSRPWQIEREGDGLACQIGGQAWPYLFQRRVSLDRNALRLDYTVDNLAQRPFQHLWSIHPLFLVEPGMKILLPEAVKEVFVNWVSDPAFGSYGETRPWPDLASGLDFSTVQSPEQGVAVKLFVPFIEEGLCSLVDPRQGHALTLQWDTALVPHLGLWLCYGGWPTDGRSGQLTVAIEPCSGMPDSLLAASHLGWCPVLQPGERISWSVRMWSHFTSMPGTLARP